MAETRPKRARVATKHYHPDGCHSFAENNLNGKCLPNNQARKSKADAKRDEPARSPVAPVSSTSTPQKNNVNARGISRKTGAKKRKVKLNFSKMPKLTNCVDGELATASPRDSVNEVKEMDNENMMPVLDIESPSLLLHSDESIAVDADDVDQSILCQNSESPHLPLEDVSNVSVSTIPMCWDINLSITEVDAVWATNVIPVVTATTTSTDSYMQPPRIIPKLVPAYNSNENPSDDSIIVCLKEEAVTSEDAECLETCSMSTNPATQASEDVTKRNFSSMSIDELQTAELELKNKTSFLRQQISRLSDGLVQRVRKVEVAKGILELERSRTSTYLAGLSETIASLNSVSKEVGGMAASLNECSEPRDSGGAKEPCGKAEDLETILSSSYSFVFQLLNEKKQLIEANVQSSVEYAEAHNQKICEEINVKKLELLDAEEHWIEVNGLRKRKEVQLEREKVMCSWKSCGSSSLHPHTT